ncbi:MAG: glucosamine-fructose-6-phosphate aminotransferase [uncultured bacterium]|nr:MAG: glucosamine-fructose-6-phosphate aminotransferase [uncultured bacterium]
MISQMEKEAREAPERISAQLKANQPVLQALSTRLREVKPLVAITIARGSSDHAATFAKYLLEIEAGIITTTAAPSVFTLYRKMLPVKNCLVLGISQSGESPDIVEMMISMRQAGAITVAFVNETGSQLANAAEYIVPLLAGKEKAVAATKTYLATLSALIQFVATFKEDQNLLHAIAKLPASLEDAAHMDWSLAIKGYQPAHNTLVIGRGFSFPAAQEAALKFKETAKIHAEAFSSAELLHGPFALIDKNFPLLFFAQQDESFAGTLSIAERVHEMGAKVMMASPQSENTWDETDFIRLPMPKSLHPICDPLLMVQAFYVMMARLSLARGLNPDAPSHLTKVTKTW